MSVNEDLSALAGLLYPIGRFARLASESADAAARLAQEFIEQYLPQPWVDEVKKLAVPRRATAGQAVVMASRLAAGERPAPANGQSPDLPAQLLSIFCALSADDQRAPADLYWPLAALRLDENALFPAPAWDAPRARQASQALWQAFCQETAQLRDPHASAENLPGYLESLLHLLQRYTWCVPSDYGFKADTSLYDHSRMTAALAAILASAPREKLVKGKDGDELALLVGGDLSGVQEFLYTISSQGAASALRGRSFYLQLLCETTARFILRQLDLPITNLVYSGGGSFYLLARPEDALKLRQVQQQVSQVLWAHHCGELYLALASMPLLREDFFDGKISGAWENLGYRLQYAKQHRFIELGRSLPALFAPQGHGGNAEQQCQVCGAEHAHTLLDRKNDTDDGVRKCPACKSYEILGDDLRQAQYLSFEEILPSPLPDLAAQVEAGRWQDVLACFGMQAVLTPRGGSLENTRLADRLVLALDDDGLPALASIAGARTVVGRRFLVNVTPRLSEQEWRRLHDQDTTNLPPPGHTKSFDLLEAQSQGIPRLGVLRMDVDNLGKLFSKGLGPQASLARVASLSFAVSLYFEGWVEVLAERQNQSDRQAGLGERLYSIYSGGDDLFFVGAWDAVVELARRIRLDFTRYTAFHPGLHTSAGIVLISGKYPLAQAALDAGAAENQAKHLQWLKDGKPQRKDAVAFLGQALPWENFGLEDDCASRGLQSAHALMHLLVDSPELAPTVTPLVRRLIALYDTYQETLEQRRKAGTEVNRARQDQVLWGPWMYLGYYHLHRLAQQAHSQSINQLNEQLKRDQFRSIEWIGLAARWAELRLRKS
jgi:CRISPR-associated protein Csm1